MFGFLNVEVIRILMMPLVALLSIAGSVWVLRKTIENTNQATPPAQKRLEIAADLYERAAENIIFSKRISQLQSNYETAADAALWESEVLRETPQQSYMQKSLLRVPYVTFMKHEITRMPPFNPPLLLDLLIGFMKFLMNLLAFGILIFCFMIRPGEFEWLFRGAFLLISITCLVLTQFFQPQK
ncbi:hypothetical protein [uncultured Rothia sp.]|uniref:hypothetical protein n=1 Tax=uncultured Rothia sp. TaxID=316088 RepID=UPI0032169997